MAEVFEVNAYFQAWENYRHDQCLLMFGPDDFRFDAEAELFLFIALGGYLRGGGTMFHEGTDLP